MGQSSNASRTSNASPMVVNGIRRGSTSKNKDRKGRVATPNENKVPMAIGTNTFAQKNLLFKENPSSTHGHD